MIMHVAIIMLNVIIGMRPIVMIIFNISVTNGWSILVLVKGSAAGSISG
jgi:hypothetical protein